MMSDPKYAYPYPAQGKSLFLFSSIIVRILNGFVKGLLPGSSCDSSASILRSRRTAAAAKRNRFSRRMLLSAAASSLMSAAVIPQSSLSPDFSCCRFLLVLVLAMAFFRISAM
ncbi:hypothetical protein KSP39_PZI021518 [Platanthera zijinensis]|uniref:Uncharacterized protein n=1 Tax=Platanthera zijinensis TaxID=2320716 RepID=A0AAP0AZ18_9ASPA